MARKKNKSGEPFFPLLIVGVVIAGLAIVVLANHSRSADAAQGQICDRSKICMLQDTLQARSGLTYVYNGKKYYLCCGGCLAGFQRDAATRSHATDPVDGKSVDKADAPAYGYKGHAYYFSSASNLAQFAKDPEKFSGVISTSRPGS